MRCKEVNTQCVREAATFRAVSFAVKIEVSVNRRFNMPRRRATLVRVVDEPGFTFVLQRELHFTTFLEKSLSVVQLSREVNLARARIRSYILPYHEVVIRC